MKMFTVVFLFFKYTSVDIHVPLVGRVDGKTGQHTGESLSPLEGEKFDKKV